MVIPGIPRHSNMKRIPFLCLYPCMKSSSSFSRKHEGMFTGQATMAGLGGKKKKSPGRQHANLHPYFRFPRSSNNGFLAGFFFFSFQLGVFVFLYVCQLVTMGNYCFIRRLTQSFIIWGHTQKEMLDNEG
ncbi:hypothetical protein CEXT_628181 [Caerostris extrusa]|uniref:Transmembrane protein n=1 Tax=Caerostris extrusa TaxID=172846 RepID=A0AAV4YE04_CAEEX|nr:hypothetical protein CEXT_628181 [Caerostris extrusa]